MNIPQLRSFCEVVRQDMSISRAADALNTSQPGISRQLRELEAELGVTILARSRNRILGLTDVGELLHGIAKTILDDAERMHSIGKEYAQSNRGSLVVATTHAHARYSLPPLIKRFCEKFPMVQLNLSQGNPTQCAEMVADGTAALGIAAEVEDLPAVLVAVPAYQLRRTLIAPKGHEILRAPTLDLRVIAEYPQITYSRVFGIQALLHNAFDQQRIKANIVLRAIDAGVIKTYVEIGLGVAVVSSFVFNPERDLAVEGRDVTHLFQPGYVNIYIKRKAYLRDYVFRFITTYAPHLSKQVINKFMNDEPLPADFLDKLPSI
jgi:LysR family cys regulon transcriptional activator